MFYCIVWKSIDSLIILRYDLKSVNQIKPFTAAHLLFTMHHRSFPLTSYAAF